MIFKITFNDLVLSLCSVIPYCGYTCRLLPLVYRSYSSYDTNRGESSALPSKYETQRNPNAAYCPFISQNMIMSAGICKCTCIDTLLKHCELVLHERRVKPCDGYILRYEMEYELPSLWYCLGLTRESIDTWQNDYGFMYGYVREYAAQVWIYKDDTWSWVEPTIFAPSLSNDIGQFTYWIVLPSKLIHKSICSKLLYSRHFYFFTYQDTPDLTTILERMTIREVKSGYKYLVYIDDQDRTFISKPITNTLSNSTIATIQIDKREVSICSIEKTDRLLQENKDVFDYTSYQEEVYVTHDTLHLSDESLCTIKTFLVDPYRNLLELRLIDNVRWSDEILVKDPLLVRNVVAQSETQLFVYNEECEQIEDCYYLIQMCSSRVYHPICFSNSIETFDNTIDVLLDDEHRTIHITKPILQDFRNVFRTFVKSIMDTTHVWELVKDQEMYYFQTASYLWPNFS